MIYVNFIGDFQSIWLMNKFMDTATYYLYKMCGNSDENDVCEADRNSVSGPMAGSRMKIDSKQEEWHYEGDRNCKTY